MQVEAFRSTTPRPYMLSDWQAGKFPPHSWDVADAIEDGWSRHDIVTFMRATASPWLGEWPDKDEGVAMDRADDGLRDFEARFADDEMPRSIEAKPRSKVAPRAAVPIGADAISNLRRHSMLDHSSEVYIARLLSEDLAQACGHVVASEGQLWAWGPTHWRAIDDNKLRLAIHDFDNLTAGTKTPIKMSRRMVDGIAHEVSVILGNLTFFAEGKQALNARNCVIEIDAQGDVLDRSHDPDDRFRFTINADFDLDTPMTPPEGSMLHRLLQGSFRDDADAAAKIDLVGEILGAAAFGLATRLSQPKAFVFLGESASNGKSTIAGLLRCLLPRGSVSSIAPAHFEDERRVVGLVGKAANVADEISAAAISGETFKAAVTGDTISGRGLYKDAVTFAPTALHVFTTNTLPKFTGFLDRGLQRRLMVLRFERTIPAGEVIADIAEQIATKELDLLMGFAIAGARRLIMRGEYTVPASSVEALKSWILLDPVAGWFDERVEACATEPVGGWQRASDLYKDFRAWALDNGHSERFLPPVTSFGARLKAMPGVDTKHTKRGSVVMGIALTEGQQARPNLDW